MIGESQLRLGSYQPARFVVNCLAGYLMSGEISFTTAKEQCVSRAIRISAVIPQRPNRTANHFYEKPYNFPKNLTIDLCRCDPTLALDFIQAQFTDALNSYKNRRKLKFDSSLWSEAIFRFQPLCDPEILLVLN